MSNSTNASHESGNVPTTIVSKTSAPIDHEREKRLGITSTKTSSDLPPPNFNDSPINNAVVGSSINTNPLCNNAYPFFGDAVYNGIREDALRPSLVPHLSHANHVMFINRAVTGQIPNDLYANIVQQSHLLASRRSQLQQLASHYFNNNSVSNLANDIKTPTTDNRSTPKTDNRKRKRKTLQPDRSNNNNNAIDNSTRNEQLPHDVSLPGTLNVDSGRSRGIQIQYNKIRFVQTIADTTRILFSTDDADEIVDYDAEPYVDDDDNNADAAESNVGGGDNNDSGDSNPSLSRGCDGAVCTDRHCCYCIGGGGLVDIIDDNDDESDVIIDNVSIVWGQSNDIISNEELLTLWQSLPAEQFNSMYPAWNVSLQLLLSRESSSIISDEELLSLWRSLPAEQFNSMYQGLIIRLQKLLCNVKFHQVEEYLDGGILTAESHSLFCAAPLQNRLSTEGVEMDDDVLAEIMPLQQLYAQHGVPSNFLSDKHTVRVLKWIGRNVNIHQGAIRYEVSNGPDRRSAAGVFYQLQLLASCGVVSLAQDDDGGDIIVTPGPCFIEIDEDGNPYPPNHYTKRRVTRRGGMFNSRTGKCSVLFPSTQITSNNRGGNYYDINSIINEESPQSVKDYTSDTAVRSTEMPQWVVDSYQKYDMVEPHSQSPSSIQASFDERLSSLLNTFESNVKIIMAKTDQPRDGVGLRSPSTARLHPTRQLSLDVALNRLRVDDSESTDMQFDSDGVDPEELYFEVLITDRDSIPFAFMTDCIKQFHQQDINSKINDSKLVWGLIVHSSSNNSIISPRRGDYIVQIDGKYLNELVPDTALDEGCCRVSYRMDMMGAVLSNIRFPLRMMVCRRRVHDAEDVVDYDRQYYSEVVYKDETLFDNPSTKPFTIEEDCIKFFHQDDINSKMNDRKLELGMVVSSCIDEDIAGPGDYIVQINDKYLHELVPETVLINGSVSSILEYIASNCFEYPLRIKYYQRRDPNVKDVVEYSRTSDPTNADESQVEDNVEFDVGGGGGFGSEAEGDWEKYDYDDEGNPVPRGEKINEDAEIAHALHAELNEGESSAAGNGGDGEGDQDENDEQQETTSHLPSHLQGPSWRPRGALTPFPTREHMPFDPENQPRISRADFDQVLAIRKRGHRDQIMDMFKELPRCTAEKCVKEEDQAIRERHIKLLTDKFAIPDSNLEWRAMSREAVVKFGWKMQENPADPNVNAFEFQLHKWYVSHEGDVARFSSVNDEPTIVTAKPKLDNGYASHEITNSFRNEQPNVTTASIKLPLSYMVFFTFYKLDEFDRKQGWVLDHINGVKHDNRFCNLWPLPNNGYNSRARDKVDRSNTSGYTGVGEKTTIGDERFLVIPPVLGSDTEGMQYSTTNSPAEAVTLRFDMEVKEDWFQKLSYNHIIYMLFYREDWMLLPIDKWFEHFIVQEDLDFTNEAEEEGGDVLDDEPNQWGQMPDPPIPWYKKPIGSYYLKIERDQAKFHRVYDGSYYTALLSALLKRGRRPQFNPIMNLARGKEASDNDIMVATSSLIRSQMCEYASTHHDCEMNHARNTLEDIIKRHTPVHTYLQRQQRDNTSPSVLYEGRIENHIATSMDNVSIVQWSDSLGSELQVMRRFNAIRHGHVVLHLHYDSSQEQWRALDIDQYKVDDENLDDDSPSGPDGGDNNNGNVCIRHGAIVKPKKKCEREGCTNYVVKGGVCVKHGARVKTCARDE